MNQDFQPFACFKLAISAYAAIWGTGFLSYIVMPYLIGSLADGMGLGIDQAGLIVMALSVVVGWHINQQLKLSAFDTSVS
jgi:hypothetical protein